MCSYTQNCVVHFLNLAVLSASDFPSIQNCHRIIEKMYYIFNTPKRRNALLEAINNSGSMASIKSLKRLCATRWIQRYDSVNDFVQLISYIVASLKNIAKWKDGTAVDTNMLNNGLNFLYQYQL